jgi:hypothetical protein
MIVAQRLRKGACNSSRGVKGLVGDAVKTAALIGGAAVSVTVRMNAQIKAAIAAIAEDAWTTIEYTDAVFDEATGRWISRAEVAETGFTAFVPARSPSAFPAVWWCVGSRTSTPRRGTLHLPQAWPWQTAWTQSALWRPDRSAAAAAQLEDHSGTPRQRGPTPLPARPRANPGANDSPHLRKLVGGSGLTPPGLQRR